MHLLPLSLGRLAEQADRVNRGGRYVLDTILLRVYPDNTFEAVATDTKVLIRVTGPCVAEPAAFPNIPELEMKSGLGNLALIPVGAWSRAFTWGRKLTSKLPADSPLPQCVAVRVCEAETTFAAANEYHTWHETVENVAGRFPPYLDIITATQRQVHEQLAVDPDLLVPLLRTAAECAPNPNAPRLTIETLGPSRPILVRGEQPGGLTVTGLLMPLNSGDLPTLPAPEAERIAELERHIKSLQAEWDELAHERARLKAERDHLAERVDELKAALDAIRTPSLPGTE